MKRSIPVWMVLSVLLLSACTTPTPQVREQAPATTLSITPSPTPTPPAEPCRISPGEDLTSYLRPSLESEVFSELSSDMSLMLMARTADGWYGFEPGIPQAANVGPFRLRWFPPESNVQLQGACENLPVIEAPLPSLCYEMAMTEIPVFAEPDPDARVVATLQSEDYVQVIEFNAEGWLHVDLGVGNLASQGAGWVQPEYANVNGACGEISTQPPPGEPLVRLGAGQELTITSITMFTGLEGWAVGHGQDGIPRMLYTTDGGESWQDRSPPEPLPQGAGFELDAAGSFPDRKQARVAYLTSIPPATPLRVSFWTTQDGGRHWAYSGKFELDDPADVPFFFQFMDSDHGRLLVQHAVGMGSHAYTLFFTSDGGQSYLPLLKAADTLSTCRTTGMQFLDDLNGWLTEACPFETGAVYVDRSLDGGVTWEQISLPPPSSDPDLFETSISCSSRSPLLISETEGALIVECQTGDPASPSFLHYFYRTTDSGETWSTSQVNAVTLLAFGEDRFYALGREMFASSNAGQSWTQIKTVAWDGQFSFINRQQGWAAARAGEDTALVATENGTRTWRELEPVSSPPLSESLAACSFTTSEQMSAYMRPSLQADIFGEVPAGANLSVSARTADGWYGFGPGVAQAANMGVFRYRWLRESDSVELTGDCNALPVVTGPAPGVCFFMPMMEVPVYASPQTSAEVVFLMQPDDYAQIEGKTADGWMRVDLEVGNLGILATGWFEAFHANMNGPCENLPTLSP